MAGVAAMNRPALFDAHLHLIAPGFPLIENQGYLPGPFTLADYRESMRDFEVVGGAVVAGSFQGTDQAWLVAALEALGPTWCGVAQLDAATSEAELRALDRHGVRALRLNLQRGDPTLARATLALARRAHDVVGWHCEVYADCARLGALETELAELPRLAIDHLGLSEAGLPVLKRLVAGGAKVKATGFGRLDFDVGAALREIAAIDPSALIFGTDLPGTRAPRPFRASDLRLIEAALGEPLARRVLLDNGRVFYSR